MLRNFVILSLCIVAIHAAGEFTVLNSPKSLSFKGNDALQSRSLVDVLLAAKGYAVDDVNWPAMRISDPFKLPASFVAVFVHGVNYISTDSNSKTFPLEGSNTDESLNTLSAELEASNELVCDINFNQYGNGVESFKSCFGDIVATPAKETKNLNPSLHNEDKQLLQIVGYINAIVETKKFNKNVIIRLSLEGIEKAHGKKSEAVIESCKLISSAIARLNAKMARESVLVVLLTEEVVAERVKRDVLPGGSGNDYNLAAYYNEDYPVIFNIILWFMVVFALALLAICYAIGAMDPGRDSIIYRMTSTRMKKDN